MNKWALYNSRIDVKGHSRRDAKLLRSQRMIERKAKDTLSFKTLIIDGEEREITVLDSDDLHQKSLCTMPGETLWPGSIVEWGDTHWIITETGVGNEIYSYGIMLRCNYLLKWIQDGEIIERWSIVEDSTKYLTGESVNTYNQNGMVLGDTRISVTLPRDRYTLLLGRDDRFIIDDEGSDVPLAYRLSKPFKVGSVYDGHGVLGFVMTEVNTEDTDDLDRRIAGYYKWFPRGGDERGPEKVTPGQTVGDTGKRVWL